MLRKIWSLFFLIVSFMILLFESMIPYEQIYSEEFSVISDDALCVKMIFLFAGLVFSVISLLLGRGKIQKICSAIIILAFLYRLYCG